MNTILATELVTDRDPTSDGTESTNSPRITNFFEARHQLMVVRQETASPKREIHTVQDTSLRYKPFTTTAKIFEQALYWFFLVPALAYLVYLIFGS